MATIKEQLQDARSRVGNFWGVRSHRSSLFIKSLEGDVLAYKHHLPLNKEEEFISSFGKENPAVHLFQVERISFPQNKKKSGCDYIYDTISHRTYFPTEWDKVDGQAQVVLINELLSQLPNIDKRNDSTEILNKLDMGEILILNKLRSTGNFHHVEELTTVNDKYREQFFAKFNFDNEISHKNELIELANLDEKKLENQAKVRLKAGYILEINGMMIERGITEKELIKEGWSIDFIEKVKTELKKATILKDKVRVHTNEQEVRHSEKDIIRQLDRLGISSSEQKVIANELLTVGKTSNLISINTNVLEQKLELPARLSLDSEGNIKVHLVRKSLKEDLEKPYMGHIFTPAEKESLLTNKNAGGVITINSLNGQQQKVLVSVDRLTGELLSLPVDKVKIPDRYKGVELSEENKSILATGEPCVIKGVPAGKWAKYDVTIQYSVDSKGIVSLPRLDRVTTIGETVLSKQESQALRNGKTIQVSNLVDDRGRKYSAYVKIKQPEDSLVVTPTNQHRVQVNHNTYGIKTDENKKAEKKANSFGIKSGKSKVEYNKSKKQPKVKH